MVLLRPEKITRTVKKLPDFDSEIIAGPEAVDMDVSIEKMLVPHDADVWPSCATDRSHNSRNSAAPPLPLVPFLVIMIRGGCHKTTYI
jgi:hypothetical protein